MAAKEILEALQSAVTMVEAYSEQDEVIKVFAYISRLSRDKGESRMHIDTGVEFFMGIL